MVDFIGNLIDKPMAIPVGSVIVSLIIFSLVRFFVMRFLKPKIEEYVSYEEDNRVESFRGFLTAIIEGGLAATAISLGIAYYFLNLLFTLKIEQSVAANILNQIASIGNSFVILSNITAIGTYIAATTLIIASISNRERFKNLSKLEWFILFIFIYAITTISLYTFRVIAYISV